MGCGVLGWKWEGYQVGFPRGAPRAHLLSRDRQACSIGHFEPFPEVMEGSEEGDAVIGPRRPTRPPRDSQFRKRERLVNK